MDAPSWPGSTARPSRRRSSSATPRRVRSCAPPGPRTPTAPEVDPDRWWEAYEQASGDGVLDGVAAIAVGGQQHGMVTLDEHDAVVRDALLWNDTRSAGAARDLTERARRRRRVGRRRRPRPGRELHRHQAALVRRARARAAARVARVVLPHDWLTGRILKQGNGFERWTHGPRRRVRHRLLVGRPTATTGSTCSTAFGRTLQVPEVLSPPQAPAGRPRASSSRPARATTWVPPSA